MCVCVCVCVSVCVCVCARMRALQPVGVLKRLINIYLNINSRNSTSMTADLICYGLLATHVIGTRGKGFSAHNT